MRAHLSIDVRDVEKSVEFYEKVFGLKPQKRSDNYAKFDLQNPALNFSMQCPSIMLGAGQGHPVSRVNHLGIEVDSPAELSQWQEKLEAQGLVKRVETQTSCCFARQDKLWFEDPDGNAWEVFYVYEQLPVHASAMKDSQCCPS
jgi:catechol 2,3-dioxygenase-like lactoylglutathione lyase family enzyme